MKSVLIIAGAVVALSSVAAMAGQNSDQLPDQGAKDRAFFAQRPNDNSRQCFNGQFIAGVNRAGDKTLYIQSPQGQIYQMRLAEGCDGLNAAEKISFRAHGSDVICPGDSAELVVRTATAAKHCQVTRVQRLTSGDVEALATAARR